MVLYGARLPIIKEKRMVLRAGFAIAICYVLIGSYRPISITHGRALVGFANGFYPAAMTMVSLSVDENRLVEH